MKLSLAKVALLTSFGLWVACSSGKSQDAMQLPKSSDASTASPTDGPSAPNQNLPGNDGAPQQMVVGDDAGVQPAAPDMAANPLQGLIQQFLGDAGLGDADLQSLIAQLTGGGGGLGDGGLQSLLGQLGGGGGLGDGGIQALIEQLLGGAGGDGGGGSSDGGGLSSFCGQIPCSSDQICTTLQCGTCHAGKCAQ